MNSEHIKQEIILAARRSILIICLMVVSFVLNYLLNIILSRWLGPENYGDVAIAMAVAFTGGTIILMGSNRLVLKVFPIFMDQEQWKDARGFLHSIIKIIVVGGIAFFFLGAMGYLTLKHYNPSKLHPLFLGLCFVPLIALVIFTSNVLKSNRNIFWGMIPFEVMQPVFTIILAGIAILIIGKVKLDDYVVIILWGVAWVFSFLFLIFGFKKALPNQIWHEPPVYQLRHWAFSSLPFMVNGAIFLLMTNGSLFMLEYYSASETSVGIYAATNKSSEFMYLLFKAIGFGMLPVIAILIGKDDKAGVQRCLNFCFYILGLAGVIFLTTFIFAGDIILGWFGPGFSAGYWALIIIGIANVVNIIGSQPALLLQYYGFHRMVVSSFLTLLILNYSLSLLLIPRFGITGAAFAYMIPTVSIYVFLNFYCYRKLGYAPWKAVKARKH